MAQMANVFGGKKIDEFARSGGKTKESFRLMSFFLGSGHLTIPVLSDLR